MAELVFFYGTMNCGKSTLALQTHHNQARSGRRGLLFSLHDRGGPVISSRLGLVQSAIVVSPDVDIHRVVVDRVNDGEQLDYLICDEACFYTPEQIDQLALVCDDFGIEVFAYGLYRDFTGHLFPGTTRLFEVADRCEAMQVRALCWCGSTGTQNARTIDGVLQRTGETVVVGDVVTDSAQTSIAGTGPEIAYEVLCRRHFRSGITRAQRLDEQSPR